MTLQPASLFSSKWTVFWATTYSFELEIFDEYLLRRLGDPPLNATILADFDAVASNWESIDIGEAWRLKRVNRDYLLRPISMTGGRFHPKTYLLANEKEGNLLVGSGNMSLSGLEEGHEVFTRFDHSSDHGLAAIRSWRRWMNQIVETARDDLITRRWMRLRQTTSSWMGGGTSAASMFVSNLESSLLDQLLTPELQSTTEVHVTAPFFDADAEALGQLLAKTGPVEVFIYMGSGANVNGPRMREVLESSGNSVSLLVYDPPNFVHAKLIALIAGKRARVLSGSGNVSRAGLLASVANDRWANIEAGAINEMAAEKARALFTPPGLEPQLKPLSTLEEHRYEKAPDQDSFPIRLLSATMGDDGYVSVSAAGDSDGAWLSSLLSSVELVDNTTAQPIEIDEESRLVWLTSSEGTPLSNRIPVDDRANLDRQLDAVAKSDSDRPDELDVSDLENPLAQILLRLHRSFVFDIDDLDALRQSQVSGDTEGEDTEDGAFWERLAKEELQADPRTAAYRRRTRDESFPDDDVVILLRMMLERTPVERRVDLLRVIGQPTGEDPEGDNGSSTGTPWTATRRLQVRIVNLLTRWALALSDPRMDWLEQFATVRNFEALIYAVAELLEMGALTRDKAFQLLDLVFSHFIRSQDADGYLFNLDTDRRESAIAHLGPDATSVATALIYAGLIPMTRWEDRIFRWQAWLTPSLEAGILQATDDSAVLASRLIDDAVEPREINDRLEWAATYIDDPKWCHDMEALCDLRRVTFSNQTFAHELVLEIESDRSISNDPEIVKLARRALDFRGADGIVIMHGDERIAVKLGEVAYMRNRSRKLIESDMPISPSLLQELETSGASFASTVVRREAS